MRQLTGAASALAAATWDAHGVPAMARVSALRHLRCDASERVERRGQFSSTNSFSPSAPTAAAAADTASALASLAHHAAVEHGPSAASATLATASHRFPREDSDALAAAAASRGAPRPAAARRAPFDGARRAASALAALAPASFAVHSESTAEACRAEAEAFLVGGRLVDARDVAATQFVASQRSGTTHAGARAALTLAETFLAAGAPASALPHALALEHSAAALRLDGVRAAAVVLCVGVGSRSRIERRNRVVGDDVLGT